MDGAGADAHMCGDQPACVGDGSTAVGHGQSPSAVQPVGPNRALTVQKVDARGFKKEMVVAELKARGVFFDPKLKATERKDLLKSCLNSGAPSGHGRRCGATSSWIRK